MADLIDNMIKAEWTNADALDLQPTCNQFATDSISRQAAIDALDALCDRECEYSKKQRSVMCGACHLGSAFDVVEQLPSAQPEPCEDAVSRQQVLEEFAELFMICNETLPNENGHRYVVEKELLITQKHIEKLPSAQPERKKGRWLPDNIPGGGFWVCSCCKFPSEAFAADVLYKFCPNCGADMRKARWNG